MAGGVRIDKLGRVIYSPSSFGGCIKALVAARQGYEPLPTPGFLQKIFDAGHEAEDLAVQKLRDAGWTISGQQDQIELVVPHSALHIVFQSHIDGYMTHPDVPGIYVCEIKSMGKGPWAEFQKSRYEGGLFPKYRYQFSIYHHATHLPVIPVRWNRSAYEEFFDSYEMVVEDPLPEEWYIPLEELYERVYLIESYAGTEDFPECSTVPATTCPFAFLHEATPEIPELRSVEDPGNTEAPSLDQDKLDDLVKKFLFWKGQLDEVGQRLDDVKTELGNLLDSCGASKAQAITGHVVSRRPGSSTKWLQDKMRGDGIDPNKYKEHTQYVSTVVTLPK